MSALNFVKAAGTSLETTIKAASGTQNYFDNVANSFENAVNTIIPFVWIAVAAAVIGIGLMCIIGNDRSKEMAKSKFIGVVVGCALVVGAVYIAKGIASTFQIGQ